MSMKSRIALITLLGLALCLMLAAVSFAGECKNEQKVTLDQLPPAVRATLENQAQGGTIGDIDKETKDGQVVYEADVVKGGNKIEVKIAENGTLISAKPEEEKEENEVKVTFDQLPAPVQATLQAQVGNGSLEEIEKETKDGKVIYKAKFTKDGKEQKVRIAEDGTLLKGKGKCKGKDHEGGDKD